MPTSIETFLTQLSRRASPHGGGSVAALSAALSAALLEKLAPGAMPARRLRNLRRECLLLVDEDAKVFARVVAAMRADDALRFRRMLIEATEIPYRVVAHSRALQLEAGRFRAMISSRYRADLTCAAAIARGASASAAALIRSNLAWLGDPAYRRRMEQRLRHIRRRHAA